MEGGEASVRPGSGQGQQQQRDGLEQEAVGDLDLVLLLFFCLFVCYKQQLAINVEGASCRSRVLGDKHVLLTCGFMVISPYLVECQLNFLEMQFAQH